MFRKFLFVFCSILFIAFFSAGVYGLISCQSEKPFPRKSAVLNTPNNDSNLESQKNQDKKPINIMFLGLDNYYERSDVIMVFNFDPNSGSLKILSIARDTMVNRNGKTFKINELYGIVKELGMINEVQKITGLTIDHYVTFSFKGFRKIIDTVDGVEVNVPFNMNYEDPDQELYIHLKKGRQLLNGKKAEQFIRYRKGNSANEGYTDADIGRIKTQQEFVKEFFKQKVNVKYLPKITDISILIGKYIKTDISISDITYYKNDILNISQDKIKTYIIPGDSKYINRKWFFIYDPEALKNLIKKEFYQ